MRRAPFPRQYGGYGAEPDILKTRIIAEEFADAGAPRGVAGQGISMLVPTLLEVGSEEQKQQLDRADAARRDRSGARAIPSRAPAPTSPRCRPSAVEDGDDFVINGQKIWTSTAHARRHDVLPGAHRAGQAEARGHLLHPDSRWTTPGIEVRPLKTMTGRAEFNEVFFTDVRVPQTQIVVGGRGRGWFVANATLKHERGMLGDPNATEAPADHADRADAGRRRSTASALIDKPVFRDRLMQLAGPGAGDEVQRPAHR